ncbi:hypothetical protein ARMGADRAFT_775366 [Armillaria gallica]|uniref:Uncharacterized protein n=1 Tax=Armillaria gallica TaxID=47427 RepID=A0A2H3CIH3_ARMGA|nr:hypothetical protein ARMGADRAFT_775366 [Armillaria gallica]
MRRAMGEEINFDRPAVSTLCNHARLPQLTHQGSQCPRDVGIPTLQPSYLKSGPVFQCVATTYRCPASKGMNGCTISCSRERMSWGRL